MQIHQARSLLGISESSTEDQIKKAFRQKARECHPDKNFNSPEANDAFVNLKNALSFCLMMAPKDSTSTSSSSSYPQPAYASSGSGPASGMPYNPGSGGGWTPPQPSYPPPSSTASPSQQYPPPPTTASSPQWYPPPPSTASASAAHGADDDDLPPPPPPPRRYRPDVPDTRQMEEERARSQSSVPQSGLGNQKVQTFISSIEPSVFAWSQVRMSDTLDLGDCQLGDAGMRVLVNALLAVDLPLKILKLHKNLLGDAGGQALSQLIKHMKHPLAELHLSHNFMSPAAIKTILVSLAENKHYPPEWGRALWFRPENQLVTNWAQFRDRSQRQNAIQKINEVMRDSRKKAGLSLPERPNGSRAQNFEPILLCDDIKKDGSCLCRQNNCAYGALVHIAYLGSNESRNPPLESLLSDRDPDFRNWTPEGFKFFAGQEVSARYKKGWYVSTILETPAENRNGMYNVRHGKETWEVSLDDIKLTSEQPQSHKEKPKVDPGERTCLRSQFPEKLTGYVSEVKKGIAWLKPSDRIDHPKASMHRGCIFISLGKKQDFCFNPSDISRYDTLTFFLYEDNDGLGATEIDMVEKYKDSTNGRHDEPIGGGYGGSRGNSHHGHFDRMKYDPAKDSTRAPFGSEMPFQDVRKGKDPNIQSFTHNANGLAETMPDESMWQNHFAAEVSRKGEAATSGTADEAERNQAEGGSGGTASGSNGIAPGAWKEVFENQAPDDGTWWNQARGGAEAIEKPLPPSDSDSDDDITYLKV